jgi:hypothetical protein
MEDRSSVDHIVATNNIYSRHHFPRGGYWGPAAYCEFADVYANNVWDGNDVPPAGGGPDLRAELPPCPPCHARRAGAHVQAAVREPSVEARATLLAPLAGLSCTAP